MVLVAQTLETITKLALNPAIIRNATLIRYQILSSLLGPIVTVILAIRWLVARDNTSVWRARRGIFLTPRPEGPLLWVHAASLGEANSAKEFLQFVRNKTDIATILVTVNNQKTLEFLRNSNLDYCVFVAAPVDKKSYVARFLKHWNPDFFVNIETEIWPNRLVALTRHGVRIVYLNARLSQKTARFWQRFDQSSVGLRSVAWFSAQDSETVENLASLGVDSDRVTLVENLKASSTAIASVTGIGQQWLPKLRRDKTVLAGSTHTGEDAIVLEAFYQAAQIDPDLKLVLIPRHPKRSQEIAKLVLRRGLHLSICSKGAADPNAQVFLYDQLGVLEAAYHLASLSFVGGSLIVKGGGHTPYEPARARSAIVSGPYRRNFDAAYRSLKDSSAMIEVVDAQELAVAFGSTSQAKAALSDVAARVLQPPNANLDVFEKVCDLLGLKVSDNV